MFLLISWGECLVPLKIQKYPITDPSLGQLSQVICYDHFWGGWVILCFSGQYSRHGFKSYWQLQPSQLSRFCVMSSFVSTVRVCSNILRSYFGLRLTPPPPKMITLLSNCDHIWALARPPPSPRSDREIFEQPLIYTFMQNL